MVNNEQTRQTKYNTDLHGWKSLKLSEGHQSGDQRCNQILLTGGTGFIGAYMLREFMEKTHSRIYCLVRAGNAITPKERILRNLDYYFGPEIFIDVRIDERIIAINGDITQDNLDLPENIYEELADNIDEVYHAASITAHLGKLEDFIEVNVNGTLRIVDFAAKNKIKVFNYISALAVSGRREDNPDNLFKETDFHENLKYPNAYVKTKCEAEMIVRDYMQKGHPARIFRPGFIMGNSKTGRFKKDIEKDATYGLIKAHIQMGVAPPLYDDDYMDVTPVDYCAPAIVHISLKPDTLNNTFHICNPRPVLKSFVWKLIRNYGYEIRFLEPENYDDIIFSLKEDDEYLRALQMVVLYLSDYRKSPAVFDTSKTLKCLEGTGIICPPANEKLIKTYLDYSVQVGFLSIPKNPAK